LSDIGIYPSGFGLHSSLICLIYYYFYVVNLAYMSVIVILFVDIGFWCDLFATFMSKDEKPV
jgi:hypothetical protein